MILLRITPARLLRTALATLFLVALGVQGSRAQQYKTPVEYMERMSGVESGLASRYLNYMSAVAHSRNARRMENKRNDLLEAIRDGLRDIGRMPSYKGDLELRNTYLEYLRILNIVFREEYHKILDLEKIAEESYDNMEAYLLAQQRASEKLREAADKIKPAYEAFAEKNNVRIVEPERESQTSVKLQRVEEVNAYYYRLYLLYFKCLKQEAYLVKAMDGREISAIEQERTTLLRFVEECTASLDTAHTYHSDGSLLNTTRKVFIFFQHEAEETTPSMIDFILTEDELLKMKEVVEAKKTDETIDAYNKAVDKYNKDLVNFNKSIESLNSGRSKVIDDWNKSASRFLDLHMPS